MVVILVKRTLIYRGIYAVQDKNIFIRNSSYNKWTHINNLSFNYINHDELINIKVLFTIQGQIEINRIIFYPSIKKLVSRFIWKVQIFILLEKMIVENNRYIAIELNLIILRFEKYRKS